MAQTKKQTSKKPKKTQVSRTKNRGGLFSIRYFWQQFKAWWGKNWWHKAIAIFFTLIALILSGSYSVSYWYLNKHRSEELKLGVTFIPNYARYFGLDPQETMQATIDELGVRRFRLVSYWKDIEKTEGTYDFSELDWQFKKAEAAGAEISLSLGLRQPRWPECHMPTWAEQLPKDVWYPKLKAQMTAVVERYKDSPSLVSYQVENEFFMTIFGECKDFDRARLVDEVDLVRKLDPGKTIVVTRSNNWGGIPIYEPTPDLYGVAVYKRVFEYTFTNRYFEYPYPSWFYSFLAGASEIYSGKPMIIHELQMEPWLPTGYSMTDVKDVPEQNKSMNADRLEKRFEYAKKSGIKIIDTWGVEWWYWRKMKANDPTIWNTAAREFEKAKIENAKIGY